MNAKEMAKLAIEALEDKKAEEIKIIDISNISTIADYFIIASGTNKSQIQTMTDNVAEVLGRAGHPEKHIEGYQNANWILMDFQDIIVHVFDKENRLFYDLERIWRDGVLIDKETLEKRRIFVGERLRKNKDKEKQTESGCLKSDSVSIPVLYLLMCLSDSTACIHIECDNI